jgi:hypothetical protein
MLLQHAMFMSSLNNKDNFNINAGPPTSPLSSTASTASSSSPMMEISPLERAFAEERERAIAASKKSPPLPPPTSAASDHNGNQGTKTVSAASAAGCFPFHPASLAAAFNLQAPINSGTALNLSNSSQKSSSSPTSAESFENRTRSPNDSSPGSNGSYKETDRRSSSSPIKEGKELKFS